MTSKGARTVWVRCGDKSKDRATVMLLGDSTGSKYPPLVIFKAPKSTSAETDAANVRERHGFGRTLWSGIEPLQDGLEIYGNVNGVCASVVWLNLLATRCLCFNFSHRLVEQVSTDPVFTLPRLLSHQSRSSSIARLGRLRRTLVKRRCELRHGDQRGADACAARHDCCLATSRRGMEPPAEASATNALDRLFALSASSASGRTCVQATGANRKDVCGWVREAWDSLVDETIRAGCRRVGMAEEVNDDALVTTLELTRLASDAVDSDDDLVLDSE